MAIQSCQAAEAVGLQRSLKLWHLIIYGIIITAEGLWERSHPPTRMPILYELHAPIWWGGLMLVAGLTYTIRFWPKRVQ